MAPNTGFTPNSDLRDAIHIPVVPVFAACALEPGDEVAMVNNQAIKVPRGQGIGVVDPFRVDGVTQYQKFWLFMRKIDGQPRHSWVSPEFPDELEAVREAAYAEGMEEGQCCYGG